MGLEQLYGGIARDQALAAQNAYAQEAVKRDPRAHQIVKRLQNVLDHANTLRASVGQTADKIVGSEPPTVLGNGAIEKQTEAVGFFAQVSELISSIDQALGYASESLRRFEKEF